METLNWKKVVDIVDRTFARYEKNLVILRETTMDQMRKELLEITTPTHSTTLPTPEAPSGPLSTGK